VKIRKDIYIMRSKKKHDNEPYIYLKDIINPKEKEARIWSLVDDAFKVLPTPANDPELSYPKYIFTLIEKCVKSNSNILQIINSKIDILENMGIYTCTHLKIIEDRKIACDKLKDICAEIHESHLVDTISTPPNQTTEYFVTQALSRRKDIVEKLKKDDHNKEKKEASDLNKELKKLRESKDPNYTHQSPQDFLMQILTAKESDSEKTYEVEQNAPVMIKNNTNSPKNSSEQIAAEKQYVLQISQHEKSHRSRSFSESQRTQRRRDSFSGSMAG
jgi:hypothetical protein